MKTNTPRRLALNLFSKGKSKNDVLKELIEKFEFEDLQSCEVCKEFRKTIMANASHCNDAKELKTAKANAYRKASKALMSQMSRAEDAHPLFTAPNILLSPGRYLNTNWEKIGEDDAEVMMTLKKNCHKNLYII